MGARQNQRGYSERTGASWSHQRRERDCLSYCRFRVCHSSHSANPRQMRLRSVSSSFVDFPSVTQSSSVNGSSSDGPPSYIRRDQAPGSAPARMNLLTTDEAILYRNIDVSPDWSPHIIAVVRETQRLQSKQNRIGEKFPEPPE